MPACAGTDGDEAKLKNMFREVKSCRMLSDFTGDFYRLIMGEGYDALADYEKSLTSSTGKPDWKK
jgi:hypothetical protein